MGPIEKLSWRESILFIRTFDSGRAPKKVGHKVAKIGVLATYTCAQQRSPRDSVQCLFLCLLPPWLAAVNEAYIEIYLIYEKIGPRNALQCSALAIQLCLNRTCIYSHKAYSLQVEAQERLMPLVMGTKRTNGWLQTGVNRIWSQDSRFAHLKVTTPSGSIERCKRIELANWQNDDLTLSFVPSHWLATMKHRWVSCIYAFYSTSPWVTSNLRIGR